MITVISTWNVCEYLYGKAVNFHQFDLVCGPIFEIRCFVQVTAASGNSTVYQRTPDIAISEVSECLQGHNTRSVFLDLLFIFYEL